jgi:hypothetical protein
VRRKSHARFWSGGGVGDSFASRNQNGNAGGWLRNGTFDRPITNQSAIDLSPAIDRALGWSYPSSGLVTVDLSALP